MQHFLVVFATDRSILHLQPHPAQRLRWHPTPCCHPSLLLLLTTPPLLQETTEWGGPSDDDDEAAQPPMSSIPPTATSLSLTSLSAACLRDVSQRPLSLSSPLLIVDIIIVVMPSSTSLFIAPSSLLSLSDVVVGATLEGCVDRGASAGALSPPFAVVLVIGAWGGSGRTSRRSQL